MLDLPDTARALGRRHAGRPPEPVHAQPRAGLPVRRRPLAVPHRAGRPPAPPPADPGPARAAARRLQAEHRHWTESRPAQVERRPAAGAGRAARPQPARARGGPGRHRAPAAPVAVPPGHGPRRGHAGRSSSTPGPRRRRPSAGGRRKLRASSTSRRTPQPVPPLVTSRSSASLQAVPAMSRWTHGMPSPTNSRRNRAAMIGAGLAGLADVLEVGHLGVEVRPVVARPAAGATPARPRARRPSITWARPAVVVAEQAGHAPRRGRPRPRR